MRIGLVVCCAVLLGLAAEPAAAAPVAPDRGIGEVRLGMTYGQIVKAVGSRPRRDRGLFFYGEFPYVNSLTFSLRKRRVSLVSGSRVEDVYRGVRAGGYGENRRPEGTPLAEARRILEPLGFRYRSCAGRGDQRLADAYLVRRRRNGKWTQFRMTIGTPRVVSEIVTGRGREIAICG